MAPQARVCLPKHREACAAAEQRSVTGVAIPVDGHGLNGSLDATCTHRSSLAARETLLTSGAEFGDGVAIPVDGHGLNGSLDATCTHRSSLAARETLLTSGAEFGDVASPAQSKRAERGGACEKAAHLHHAEGGEHPAEFLDSSHTPGSHAQGQRAPCGSDLVARASVGSAHSPVWHSVKKARKAKEPGFRGKSMTPDTMVPAAELPNKLWSLTAENAPLSAPFWTF